MIYQTMLDNLKILVIHWTPPSGQNDLTARVGREMVKSVTNVPNQASKLYVEIALADYFTSANIYLELHQVNITQICLILVYFDNKCHTNNAQVQFEPGQGSSIRKGSEKTSVQEQNFGVLGRKWSEHMPVFAKNGRFGTFLYKTFTNEPWT